MAWRWKSENFGRAPDFNWEVTPLMVGGVLYFTAGTRRDVVAVDAATGETLWMYRLDEGARGATVAPHASIAAWLTGATAKATSASCSSRPAINWSRSTRRPAAPSPASARTASSISRKGLDRAVVKPGQIGASSPAIVVRDVVVVGAALQAGTAPASKNNVPGYIRGFDVRTGKRLWTFHTIPQPGEFGNETWENDSWKYTGNTGAWAPLQRRRGARLRLVPVETPTGDFYGGHRPGDNLFSDSLVCLDARTGKRVWHFQLVHHDIWDWDIAAPPILLDITVGGRRSRPSRRSPNRPGLTSSTA